MELLSCYHRKGLYQQDKKIPLKIMNDIFSVHSFHSTNEQKASFGIKKIQLLSEDRHILSSMKNQQVQMGPFSAKHTEQGEIYYRSNCTSKEELVTVFSRPYSGRIIFTGDFILEGPSAKESEIKFFDVYDRYHNHLFIITVGNTYQTGYEFRPVYSTPDGYRVTQCFRFQNKLLQYGVWYTASVAIDTEQNTLKFFLNGQQIGADSCYPYLEADEGFELLQCQSNGGYILIRDKLYPLMQGAIYIIPQSEVHSINPSDEEQLICSKFFVSKKNMFPYISEAGLKPIWDQLFSSRKHFYRVFDYETTLEIDQLFQKIFNAEKHPAFFTNSLLTAHVTELLILLYTREYQSSYNYPKHISEIMQYINKHLKEEISIDSLCCAVHLSKSYACSSFKNYTNMTITQYLIQCRLTQAKKHLLETESSISEIAMQTGFSSFSFFCQTFRKYESCTPLQFRKMYQTAP